jgi:hypothetical protein
VGGRDHARPGGDVARLRLDGDTGAGQRVFNVLFEGVKVLPHLDVVATVGPNAAYDVTLPVRVTDGQLNIAFLPVVDYATVSAIVVQAN